MRHFLPIEKKVIDFICDAKPFSNEIAVNTIINKFCPCSARWNESTLILFYNEDKYTDSDVISSIMNVVCLFDYLERQNLAYFFERNNISDINELINRSENHSKYDESHFFEERHIKGYNQFKFSLNGKEYVFDNVAKGLSLLTELQIPWSLAAKVARFSKSALYCTETLRHIRRQNYQDDATVQHKENQCQAWVAIAISAIIGISSLVCNCRSGCNCMKDNEAIVLPQKHTYNNDSINLHHYIDLE